MRRRRRGWWALAGLSWPGAVVGQTDARALVRVGDYDAAIEVWREAADGPAGDAGAGRGLIRALLAVGRTDEADREARRLGDRYGVQMATVWGEVQYTRGRFAQAEATWVRAAGAASDSLTARLRLAVARWERGARSEAVAGFDQLIDLYNRGSDLSPEELTAVAGAAAYRSVANPGLARDALRVYDRAATADTMDLTPRVRAAELLLAKYNNTDADRAFRDILAINPRHPDALLGLARSLHFDQSPEAWSATEAALAVNPNLVPARTLRAQLALEVEDWERAETEARAALAIDAGASEAWAVLGAARRLQDDTTGYAEAEARALVRNPRNAAFYTTVAEAHARNRRYADAVALAAQAVALDTVGPRAYAVLGINELRVGAMTDGRTHLEQAFAHDPFDLWTKNTLDLLDTFSHYRIVSTEHFRLVLHEDEADRLAPLVGPLAEAAYAALAVRYGHEPPTPIRLELFPRHADFSVRTVGLAGLGALGVSFGNVVAMDSPSARDPGAFHWGSTLWHEIAHTFHLSRSGYRVPRWFSEGLAVFEERRARPGWGSTVSPAFLRAYADDRLHAVSGLNDGFVRPDYPAQVGFSYVQASLVCALIVRDWGEHALVAMLDGWGRGLSTPQVIRGVLGVEPSELDARFDTYMRERFTVPLAALSAADRDHPRSPEGAARRADRAEGDYIAQLTAGRAWLEAGQPVRAIPYLTRARDLFPDYAGGDSPYWWLARAHRASGDLARAAQVLAAQLRTAAGHYPAYVTLAEVSEQMGDSATAVATLTAAQYVYPLAIDAERRRAELHEALDRWPEAVGAWQAVLALDPVDWVEAQYRLARAWWGAGDGARARRAVLRALERAPNFEAALDLLVAIRAAGAS